MSRPIVLIGAARSGTKFLRDLLAAGEGARAVPYDVNYVWRYGAANTPHDVLDPADLNERQAGFIRRTLRRLAGIRRGDDQTILVEKTVSNTLRVPYVAAALPEARFVHLIRNGCDVAESAMRHWQAPPDWAALGTKLRRLPLANAGYAFWFARNTALGLMQGRKGGRTWGPRYPGIEEDAKTRPLAEVCALQWRHSVETAQCGLARLSSDRVHEIRYEDLIRRPESLMELCAALELPDAGKVRAAYDARLQPTENSFLRSKLSEKDRDRILSSLSPALTALGYDAGGYSA